MIQIDFVRAKLVMALINLLASPALFVCKYSQSLRIIFIELASEMTLHFSSQKLFACISCMKLKRNTEE